MTSGYQVFLGLDVGKGEHHAVALDATGKRLHDAPLPNTEPRLRAVFDKLARHGTMLVVVDQPATIGALPVAVARALGHQVAYLPGLAMRRIADLYPGNAKTDARDAHVIADAARTLPHTLRAVDTGDDTLAELGVLVGFDDDLAAEATRISNRVRGLLTGIHPALERALGPRVTHPAVLEILSRCGGPAGIRKAGRRKVAAIAAAHAPRMGDRLVEQVWTALDEQTVTVPGTTAADTVLPRLAHSLKTVLHQRRAVADEVEGMLDDHPLAEVLTSMPGIGVRTAARILLEVGDASGFASSAHLAAYAGIAPVTRRSGTSIKGEHPARTGNRKLKRAFFLAAFAALSDPTSRGYYQRKRDQGKKHNAALICLARRRCDVLFAMLRTKTHYRPPPRPLRPRLRLDNLIGTRYLLAYLSSAEVVEWIRNRSKAASAVASINAATLGQLPVVVPPEEEQRRIGDALTVLDEQIAAYRELADTTRRVHTTLSDYLLPTSY